jgi:5-(carboxyamino)imidazole ribonucleotide mutase
MLAAQDEGLQARMRLFQQELNDQATDKGRRLRARVGFETGFGFGNGR